MEWSALLEVSELGCRGDVDREWLPIDKEDLGWEVTSTGRTEGSRNGDAGGRASSSRGRPSLPGEGLMGHLVMVGATEAVFRSSSKKL